MTRSPNIFAILHVGSDLVAIVIPLRASGEEGRCWAASAPTRLSAPGSGSDRVLAVSARCGAVVVESSTPVSPSALAMYAGNDVARAVAGAADASAALCRQRACEFGESEAQPARLAGAGLWWRTLRIPVPPSADDASAVRSSFLLFALLFLFAHLSFCLCQPPFVEVIVSGPRSAAGGTLSGGAASRPCLPTVVYPHGGPHAAWSTTFHRRSAFLALSGYVVLKVNYRGSTGFGAAALSSLLGRVGDQDVEDVLLVLDTLLANNSAARNEAAGSASASDALDLNCVLPAERVAYVGGSHGGFIGAHILGQRPAAFRCAVLRNPVCNIASMVGVTDIPDWCFVEAGLPYDFSAVPTASPEQLATMWRKSPIQHVHSVTAPVLVCIGANDRRVPPSNGREWFQALRFHQAQRRSAARAAEPATAAHADERRSRMLWYPNESHPLAGVECELNMWPEVLTFLDRYTATSRT